MSNATATDNLLVTQNLHKKYRMGSEDLHVLSGVDVSVKRGEWLCILGRSGSGKSTLLHLMGGLDTSAESKLGEGTTFTLRIGDYVEPTK